MKENLPRPDAPSRGRRSLVSRVEEYIRTHDMFRPADTVAVAVSGGPDSVALLHILRELSRSWGLRLVVCHLDHRLRGTESSQDAAFVLDLANDLELAVEFGECDVAALARRERIGLEEAGRKARYEFLEHSMIRHRAACTALGHTADDQVETVIHRIIRGTGLRGIRGMAPVRDSVFVRPLLGIWRQEILQYLHAKSLKYRLDASNADLRFARNRIRLQLLPYMQETFGRGVSKAVQRLATTAREDCDYLEAEALRQAGKILKGIPDGSLCCLVSDLLGLPPALRRRAILHAFQTCIPGGNPWEYAHVERVLGLTGMRRSGKHVELPQGLTVNRQFDQIVFHRETGDPPKPIERTLTIPGKLTCAEYHWELSAASAGACSEDTHSLADDSMAVQILLEAKVDSLAIRTFREGARWRADSRKKIKNCWNTYKVPRMLRGQLPLVYDGSRLVWIPGLPLPAASSEGGGYGVRIEFRFNPDTLLGRWLQTRRGAEIAVPGTL